MKSSTEVSAGGPPAWRTVTAAVATSRGAAPPLRPFAPPAPDSGRVVPLASIPILTAVSASVQLAYERPYPKGKSTTSGLPFQKRYVHPGYLPCGRKGTARHFPVVKQSGIER